jgi:hypothetical protein
VADALLGFEYVKELYVNDDDFASVFGACEKVAFGKFYRLDDMNPRNGIP